MKKIHSVLTELVKCVMLSISSSSPYYRKTPKSTPLSSDSSSKHLYAEIAHGMFVLLFDESWYEEGLTLYIRGLRAQMFSFLH